APLGRRGPRAVPEGPARPMEGSAPQGAARQARAQPLLAEAPAMKARTGAPPGWVGGIFNIGYGGGSHAGVWHQSWLVGASCLAYAALGAPFFLARGYPCCACSSLVTSACSFWADYWHIARPDHFAHRLDRVVAFQYFFVLSFAGLSMGMDVWCMTALAVSSVGWFVASRRCGSRELWVLLHSTWHLCLVACFPPLPPP
ncbi:unnamed protein product, partial [Prorocentrum cordatum]